MSLLDFIRLLNHYKKVLIVLPVAVAIAMYFFASSRPQLYKSQMLIHTGIVPSGDGANENTARVDVYAVNNAFDNLQTIIFSRQVMEETGLRLMAAHLNLFKTNPEQLEKSIREFWEEQPNAIKKIKGTDVEAIYVQLYENINTGIIQEYLKEETSLYSNASLKKGLQLKRSGSSDIIELSFQASEASICQQTLLYLSESFAKRFREIRKSEAGNMVAFFENEVEKAAQQLSNHGEEMKEFQKQNRIINYYEQTHLTAIETEHLNGQFYEEQMKLAAAQGALNELKAKVGSSVELALSSESIIQSQDLLASLHTQLLIGTVDADSTDNQIKKEESKLRRELDNLYVDGRTEEGVSKKDVLKQWLEQFIKVSEAKARVAVMAGRKREQEKMYDFFAPLGSKLHNYERQIDVAEREYLDLLHSLNQARLRQQSVETSNTLSIVDPPFLPLNAEPSKLKLLVIIGWLGTVIILVSSILAMEYIDSTLQSPERAEQRTGLEVIGALPFTSNVQVYQLSWKAFTARILTHVFSTQQNEINILMVAKNKGALCKQIGESLKNELVKTIDGKRKINITWLPTWDEAINQWNVFQNINLLMYVCPSNHTWSNADNKVVELLGKASGIKPSLVIHDIESERLESWIGEIPKERSRLRKLIKRIVKFQFH